MSYEVFIDVEHHPKHSEEERKADTCFKWSDVEGRTPLEHVVISLRAFADEIDPNVMCSHCGERRGDHHMERDHPASNYRCFNRLGPVTQAKWWENNPADESDLLGSALDLAEVAERALDLPEPPGRDLQEAIEKFRRLGMIVDA